MTPTQTASKKTYHHGDLRQQLLNTAAQMIRDSGESALSMRKLATKLGVSRMAPYHHFVDKQTLLCAIAEEGFHRFALVVSDEPGENIQLMNEGSFTKEDLHAFVTGYIEFAVNNSEYYDLMFGGHLWKSDQLTESLKKKAHTSFKSYLSSISQLKQKHLINPSIDPLKYAQISWSTLHGMSRLLIDGIYVDQTALHSLCDSATDSLWLLLHQTTAESS